MANTLKFSRNGAAKPRVLRFTLVGFIGWLDVAGSRAENIWVQIGTRLRLKSYGEFQKKKGNSRYDGDSGTGHR